MVIRINYFQNFHTEFRNWVIFEKLLVDPYFAHYLKWFELLSMHIKMIIKLNNKKQKNERKRIRSKRSFGSLSCFFVFVYQMMASRIL